MRYQDAITDRTATDIANKTSKAYFNVSDWLRIYNNIRNANLIATIAASVAIPFTPVEQPQITSFPDVADFNTMLDNLERTRVEFAGYLIPGTLTSIKHDWVAGNGRAPTYTDVNLWESTAEAIYMNIATAVGFVDFVAPVGSPVRRHRTNIAICGAGLGRNNGYVQYA